MAATPLLPILLFFLSFSASTAADIPIHHPTPPSSGADSPLNSILSLARSADPARLSLLLSQKTPAGTSVPVASGQNLLQTPSYVLRASLGSPPQPLLLSLDTGSDSTWAPCSPCSSCPPSSAPPFSPSNSSSFSPLLCSSPFCTLFTASPACPSSPSPSPSPCSYSQSYADSSFTASLSGDSLRLALDVIPNYVFGCVTSVTGPASNMPKQGLLGLGRGPMSLLSQTGDLYKGVFSYCLPSYKSYYFSGSLRLGPVGQPKSARFTPLLKNPHRPSLYYVNMTGISVGRVKVPAPPGSFAFDPSTGAGTVVDSGTVVSRLTAPVYAALREEFRRQVDATGGYSSLGVFDTCFSTDEVGTTPPITLHMDGVDLTLPVENTLIHSSATPLACLAMAEAPPNVNAVVNVVANLQQQNLRVVVDAANSRVGFARELCN